MRRVDDLLDEYADHHRDHRNKVIHWWCVPIISLCTVGLLWSVPLVPEAGAWCNLGVALLCLAMVYYVLLSPRLALGMLVMCALIAVICGIVWTWSVSALRIGCGVLFVLAWIAQFLGHKREGKKPAFLKDVQFLLIGPLWLIAQIMRR
jgi:uncharacterized membrane protein YGL010W